MKQSKRVQKLIVNHEKLIAIMENLPKNKHDQGTWGEGILKNEEDNPACGTRACALGWAALSGEIEGLTAKPDFDPIDSGYFSLEPYHRGRKMRWHEVGVKHFGDITTAFVFMEGDRKKAGVIRALKERLKALKNGDDKGNF